MRQALAAAWDACTRGAAGAARLSVKAVTWPVGQARGFATNVWGLVGDRERILPTPVQQTWQQIKGALPEALGFKGDAQDQIVASVLLAVLAYASSVVTAGLTIALGVLFTITALIGVLRMIPAVGDRFTDARRNGGDRSWDVRRR